MLVSGKFDCLPMEKLSKMCKKSIQFRSLYCSSKVWRLDNAVAHAVIYLLKSFSCFDIIVRWNQKKVKRHALYTQNDFAIKKISKSVQNFFAVLPLSEFSFGQDS